MPRSSPHHLALFSLLPHPHGDERGKSIIGHPSNARFTSWSSDGVLALDIGSHIHGRASKTLAVIGRGTGIGVDITVEGPSISKIQCSFDIDWSTGVVMLHDRSRLDTTCVLGPNVVPFEHGRNRQVVVREGVNNIIGMGRGNDFVRFELKWHQDLTKSKSGLAYINTVADELIENPALSWTTSATPTEIPLHRETRLHAAGSHTFKIRYATTHQLGSGQFGEVHKAVDIDTGRLMAVKTLRPRNITGQAGWRDEVKHCLKREIEILSIIRHPNVVDYIASQGWYEGDVEIFMGLKEGTLRSLIQSGEDVRTFVDTVLWHMLQALDCIACKGIIHRDVKPENILYITNPNGKYHFQLGDFGLCNWVSDAATFTGSPRYMAPEVFRGEEQSCKADVWSLFVTILEALDINGFREANFKAIKQVHNAVLNATSSSTMSQLKEMAISNPLQRASAAQMLVKLYKGEGLSSPRRQVPSIPADSNINTTLEA